MPGVNDGNGKSITGLYINVTSTSYVGLFGYVDGCACKGMIAAILWRPEGEPAVNYILPFDDVAQGAWYAEAVR